MRSRKFRLTRCLDPSQILQKVKRQMERQKQYQKIQQNLLYLNNSFNNNIQIQQIFLDFCKGKKKNIKSKELKSMYALFSQNKANLCIFQKIAEKQKQQCKIFNPLNQSTLSKWGRDSQGLVEIIEEEQPQSNKNIKSIRNSSGSQIQIQSGKNLQKEQNKDQNKDISRKNRKNRQSSIIPRNSYQDHIQNEKQYQFLLRRIYCRIIQKILVKIAFYSMNNKFLDFLALNMLQITKNLQTIIRRLTSIKDLRLLQNIIIKVYQQNMMIQTKIYQILIDGGYILSIDQFYRVNGIDIIHKDVFQRNSVDVKDDSKRKKITLKQKIKKVKDKKQQQNVVKKDYIDRTNKQINDKYLYCISQMKKIVQKIQQEDQDKQQDQVDEQTHKKPKRISNNFSKTQPLPRASYLQKPSRFSKASQENPDQQQLNTKESQISVKPRNSEDSLQIIRKTNLKSKTLHNFQKRISSFSAEFTKLIKNNSQNNGGKSGRDSVLYSEKFLEFNQFDKKQRKQSKTHSLSQQSQNKEKNLTRPHKQKKSELFQTFAINKLLRLYQMRNTNRYSVDDFLGQSARLPQKLRQSLKEELLGMKCIYDPNSKRSSNPSNFQIYAQLQKKNSQRLQSRQSQMNSKFQSQEIQTEGSQKLHKLSPKNKNKQRNGQIFQAYTFLKKQESLKKESQQLTKIQNNHQKIQLNQKQYILEESSAQYVSLQKLNEKDVEIKRQFSLVKLQNERTKINKKQKIASFNNSLFTNSGVKNLIPSSSQNELIPLKNQKLKKIPYFKIRQQKEVSNKSSISPIRDQKYSLQISPQHHQGSKLFKKAYKSFHVKSGDTIQEEDKRVISQKINALLQKKQNSKLGYLNSNMENTKNSLHQQTKVSFQQKSSFLSDLNSDKYQRFKKYNTFYPKFFNNCTQQANILLPIVDTQIVKEDQNGQGGQKQFYERQKKYNTCHISPSQSNHNSSLLSKQNQFLNIGSNNNSRVSNSNTIIKYKKRLQKIQSSVLFNQKKLNAFQKQKYPKRLLQVYDIRKRQIIFKS